MADEPASMPTIPFSAHRLSRLILGANPINGGSHLSRFVNEQMKRYFTRERILGLLSRCEELGINAWQSGPANLELYRAHCQAGGSLHYLSLASDGPDAATTLQRLVAAGTIGIAHHGEVTDDLLHQGQLGQAREFCRKVRDSGAMVGVSTHIPAVVERITEEAWDVDFFMCCVYERHRSRDELRALLGDVPIPLREVYLEGDPPRMFAAMRATDKPCLAFKILAAGRLSDRAEWVEEAFASSLRQMKPIDALIVGMYPEYEDQPAIDAEYVRRFSPSSGGAGASPDLGPE